MRIVSALAGLVLSLAFATGCTHEAADQPSAKAAPTQAARMLVLGGPVHGQPAGTALVLAGNRIAFVGPEAEARTQAGEGATVIDAAGGWILPGFHDAHMHMRGAGLQMTRVQLAEVKTLAEAVGAIEAYAKANPNEPWIQGRGWPYGIVPSGTFPTRHDLDRVVKDRPVFVRAYDGHTGWANSKALELSGIVATTKDPADGKIVREADGKTPSGILLEGAMDIVFNTVPKPSREQKLAALERAVQASLEMGITSLDDITIDAEELELYAELDRAGKLPLRVTVSPPIEGPLADYARLKQQYTGPFVRFGFVKGFVDGVIESKTAYMLSPYEDGTPGGAPLIAPDKLDELVQNAHRSGFQVALHAIGDAGVRLSLDAFERAKNACPFQPMRHRIEHIESVDPADVPRFKALDVIASMQPLHADPLDPKPLEGVYSKNLGAKRLQHNFAWRELRDAGAVLAFGSDWPVMSQNPLWGLAMALTRQTNEGLPKEGWGAHQTVLFEDAIRAYSYGAAYAITMEGTVGTLAAGQLADVVVLDPAVDPKRPETLWKGKPAVVIVDGLVRHTTKTGPMAAR